MRIKCERCNSYRVAIIGEFDFECDEECAVVIAIYLCLDCGKIFKRELDENDIVELQRIAS